MQSKKAQEKIKETLKEKYGVEHPLQNKELQEKFKQTCLEKYGVEFSSQNEEIKIKISKAIIENSYEKIKSRVSNYVIPLFTKDEYNGRRLL